MQHDYEITHADANTGITFRAAVNAALQSLATNNSGDGAPAVTYPCMLWPDTASGLLKMRNSSNSAWVTLGPLDTASLGLTIAQQLKGDAIVARWLDTGVSGKEFGIRSDGGELQFCENTGSESSPNWEVRARIDSGGIVDPSQSTVGSYILMSGPLAPDGYLPCDNSLISATTYRRLADYWYSAHSTCCPYGLGSSTSVTVDSGTDTITWTSHGLSNGDTVYFTATTIPAGLTAKYPYYVRDVTANTFKVAATVGGAAIDITSNGTAVLGYKQFKLPDWRGKFPRAWANGSSNDPDRASRTDRGDGVTGDYVGTNQADEFKSHDHNMFQVITNDSTGHGFTTGAGYAQAPSGNGGNETRPINMSALFAIKY